MSVIKVRMWPLLSNVNSNPYVSLILSDNIEYVKHDWRSSFNTDFDIFHMHWPETYINSEKVISRLAGSFLVIFYLLYLKLIGKRIIWTVHNVKPHDNSIFGSDVFYKALVLLADKFIFMSQVSFVIFSSKYKRVINNYVLIPHPLYPSIINDENGSYKGIIRKDKELLFFGLIRKYKNVESLVVEFKKNKHLPYKLHVLGFCEQAPLKERLLSLSRDDFRIYFEFIRYSESYLDSVLNSSSGVIIPYGNMVNSGILFKCISQGVCILLPNDDYNKEVINYFDYENYMFYENELTYSDISDFTEFVESSTSFKNVDVTSHNRMVINKHFQAYGSLIKIASRK